MNTFRVEVLFGSNGWMAVGKSDEETELKSRKAADARYESAVADYPGCGDVRVVRTSIMYSRSRRAAKRDKEA